MDRRKYQPLKIIIILSACWLLLPDVCSSDDFKKPLLKLPEVNIVDGQKNEELSFLGESDNRYFGIDEKIEAKKTQEESSGFLSGAYGRFNSKMFEILQSSKTENFYYSTHFKFNDSDGSRDNSRFTEYQPDFSFGMPLDGGNEFLFKMEYFYKDMELPGKITSPILNQKRKNTDFKISTDFLHDFDELSLKLTPYFEHTSFNDAPSRDDFKNRVVGARAEFSADEDILDVDIYQTRLIKHHERIILDAKIRLEAIELSDNLQLKSGANIFAQEGFGQRPAPYLELIFKEDENCLHRFTITRNFKPVIFSKEYLKSNFIEVNPNVMRPQRETLFSYQIDKYISRQWRMNGMIYFKKEKDSWFLNDTDDNGFYSLVPVEEVNSSGIKISTEYTWSETFSNFFSIDARRNRSEDARFEFIPYGPKYQISAGLAYKFNQRGKIDFIGDYFGRRYFKPNSKESSAPYFMLSSKLTYEPKDYLTFFILIDNLLNDHYEIAKGYPNQSRNILSGITVKF